MCLLLLALMISFIWHSPRYQWQHLHYALNCNGAHSSSAPHPPSPCCDTCSGPPEEAEETSVGSASSSKDMFVLVRTEGGSIGYLNTRLSRVMCCFVIGNSYGA